MMKPLHSPFTIVIDTREQVPFSFEDIIIGGGKSQHQLIVETKRAKLNEGDYSIEGMADQIAIERKSKTDLYGTIGRGRDRFIRELGRLNQKKFAAVIVESEWYDCIKDPPERAKISPAAINGSILAFQQRFIRVHWYWMPGPYAASKQCWKILNRFYIDNA